VTSTWWIRRDLRLADNPALDSALEAGDVLPVFILDPAFSSSSPRRKSFLYEGLAALDKDLRARNSYLVIRHGSPLEVLRQLLAETKATTIVAEEDYTPYAHRRDSQIAAELPLKLIAGQTAHRPNHVTKADGKPYTVYTPYSKAWKSLLTEIHPLPAPENISTPKDIFSEPLPAYETHPHFPAGEAEAQSRLTKFTESKSGDFGLQSPITNYSETRNRMDMDGTSALSPYVRFGMISMRQAVHATKFTTFKPSNLQPSNPRSAETWLNELIWREFYIQILYHFPRIAKTAFNPTLANIPWRNDEAEFKAWKEGQTGIPIVDAAMRQLKETGWVHNRARMIVASFLVKDLLIDWRWGETWFMENLLDGDIAPNNGGWQWTAGTGTDAAPYFRIFNPVLQSAKFDPEGNYIRKWIPELGGLDAKQIHAPWELGIKVKDYPEKPIVDRSIVKERTMKAYNRSKTKG
jgi:deoxyribodipyrimidine photo-lyase